MKTKTRGVGAKARLLRTTVGDLIAAIFDVVGDQVDQVADLLRYEQKQKSASPRLLVEDPARRPIPLNRSRTS